MRTYETARRVMITAHQVRRAAAEKFSCRISEIHWGECLRMAWASVKTPAIRTNDAGFVMFQHRNFRFNGDRNAWARVEKNGTITVCMGRGIMSDEYMAELSDFCAAHGRNFSDLHTGCRITLTR